jgi:ligand-binding sensor domain-containing protein
MDILRYRFLHIAFLLTISQLSRADLRPPEGSPQPRFRNFSVEHGLPSSEAYFVYQDKTGYIWVCTDRGVARYNGNRFTLFTVDNGLLDNVVFKMYEDPKGRLWFVSKGFGLCYYYQGKIRPYRYNHVIEKQWKSYIEPDKCIAVDSADNVYYSCQHMGVLKIDRYGHLQHMQEDRGSMYYFLIGKSTFWWSTLPRQQDIADLTPHHRPKVSLQKQQGTRYNYITHAEFTSHLIQSVRLPGDELTAIARNIISTKYRKSIRAQENMISLSAIDHDVWIGLMKNGIRKYRLQADQLIETGHYLQGYSVSSICRDKEGGYWFSTLEGGIFYCPNLSFLNYTQDNGLIDNYVTSMVGIKNQVLAGFMYADWQEMTPPYRYDISNKVSGNTIFGHSDTKIYVCNTHLHPLGHPTDTTYFSWASAFYPDRHSMLVAGMNVFRIYDNGRIEYLYKFNENPAEKMQSMFASVMIDRDRRVWAGNYFGLYEIANHRLIGPKKKDPLFSARISGLAFHPDWGNIAATRGEGVFCFRGTQILRQISEKEGLLSHQVNCLFVDSNGIWVGTSKGINYLTLRRDGSVNIETFTTHHGLVSNEVTDIYRYQSTLWVGTKKGITRVNLAQFRRSKPSNAAIHFTNLQTGDLLLTDNRRAFDFPRNQQAITIRYDILNYRVDGTRKIAFRLSPADAWQYTSIPEIALSNLASGNYQVAVKYLNEDGIWSPHKTICSFTIALPFWATWYFITGSLLILVTALFLLIRLRLKQIQNKLQLQKKMNQLEQKALRAQMNPHFIFNALNSIQRFLIHQENDKAEKYLLKFASLIRQTLNNSREPYISIASEISILEKYLELEQMRFQHKFEYHIYNDLTTAENGFGIPPMLIQPYVENAILHGFSELESGGVVELYFLELRDNQLTCLIDDNGIGRKASATQSTADNKSFGTTITAERLAAFQEKYGDHFRIEIIDKETDGIPQGTKVILHIPIVTPGELISHLER